MGAIASDRWLRRAFRLWLGLMALFSVGRLFYLFDYRGVLTAEPWAASEVLYVWLSALRFDAMVAAALLSPLVLLGFLGMARMPAWLEDGFRLSFRTYAMLAFTIAWACVMVDHYFYVYFKDHFNVFFWEFFEDPANASLVVGGLGDVVPMPLALSLLALGIAAGIAFVWRETRVGVLNWPSGSRRRFMPAVWLLLFVLALRGTFDPRPLTLQDRRIVISRNSLVNLLHTNPFVPMFRGWRDRLEVQAYAQGYDEPEAQVAAHFAAAAPLVPGAEARVAPQGYHYFAQKIAPEWRKYLKRKPEQVVLLFMESYARWLIDYDEGGFNQEMAAGFRELTKGGWYFRRHFSPAGGTIKNIAAANYSFPTTREFHPALPYHKEAYKPFPGRLPAVMKKEGYAPKFFYGGVVSWHRLYQFLPAIGYEALLGENSFPDLPHHEHGLFDGGLLEATLADLKARPGPGFTFVMSLTNHPPYNVPPGAEQPEIHVPESLRSKVLDDYEAFKRRLVAYRYADRSLLKFIRDAEAAGLGDKTLFVITGDHAFNGGIGFPAEFGWKGEQIPLLLYGPGILKDEYVGRTDDTFTTHLDLVPTLLSLVTEKEQELQTFGKVVMTPGAPKDTGVNHYFSCLDGYCLKDGRLAKLSPEELLVAPPPGTDEAALTKQIQQMETHYYGAAMHYIFGFKP